MLLDSSLRFSLQSKAATNVKRQQKAAKNVPKGGPGRVGGKR